MLRGVLGVAGGLVLLPVVLAAAGFVYQQAGAWRDRRRFTRLGRMVEIAPGRRLYVAEVGSGAGPTVVFESGIAATSQNWHRLQQAVGAFARTVSYDRAGLGFSSAGGERTPGVIVEELRRMLERAGVAPPYVLVGHSFGGLVVRRFAAEHPEEVQGVVLLDPMRPEEWPPLDERQAGHVARGLKLTGIAVPIARLGLARLACMSLLCRGGRVSGVLSRAAGQGGLHVLDRVSCEVGKMPEEVWPVVAAHWSSPRFYQGMAAHLRAIPATVREMDAAAPIAGVPVLLLGAETVAPVSAEGLRRIGDRVEQVVVAGSGHWVHLDRHEVVLEAIREMVERARAAASGGFPAAAGETAARADAAELVLADS